jgi:hypothetical protein
MATQVENNSAFNFGGISISGSTITLYNATASNVMTSAFLGSNVKGIPANWTAVLSLN